MSNDFEGESERGAALAGLTMRTPLISTGAPVRSGDHGLLGLRLLRRLLGMGGRARAPAQPTPAISVLPPIDFEGEDTSLTQAELELLK
jgi:hypothetical protein